MHATQSSREAFGREFNEMKLLLSCLCLAAVLIPNGCDAFQITSILKQSSTSSLSRNDINYVKPMSLIYMSSSSERDEERTPADVEVPDVQELIEGRKSRVVTGYRAASLSYLCSGLIYLMKQKLSPFLIYLVSGPVLASGVTYILSGAAEADRLGSDTYKRLNLYTALYASIGLSLPILAPEVFSKPIFIVPPLLALVNSVKGYTYGALGWEKNKSSFSADLKAGMNSTISTLFKRPKSVKSFGYLVAAITVGTMKLFKLVQIVDMFAAETVAIKIATRLLRFGRLAMLAAVLFTLKDAADRDRLEGTTFIELNFLSSFALASMAMYVASVGGRTVNTKLLTAVLGSLAIFTGFNGASSMYKKKRAS